MPVVGQDIVIKNIIKFGGGFTRSVNKTMREVLQVLDDKVSENIGLTDHSLKDLADMDHPYARRHGSSNLHDPDFQVHKQSGRLASSKQTGIREANITGGSLQASVFVKLDPNLAPYAYSVVYGTSRMLPRPVLQGSRDQVVGKLIELLQTNLKNATISTNV